MLGARLYLVTPMGNGACHVKDPVTNTSRPSCYYRRITNTFLEPTKTEPAKPHAGFSSAALLLSACAASAIVASCATALALRRR